METVTEERRGDCEVLSDDELKREKMMSIDGLINVLSNLTKIKFWTELYRLGLFFYLIVHVRFGFIPVLYIFSFGDNTGTVYELLCKVPSLDTSYHRAWIQAFSSSSE